jgi:hypothetical protein
MGDDDQKVSERAAACKRAADRLVIDMLAASEAELLARVADLETDNRSLREVLHESVAVLAVTLKQRDRQSLTIERLHQALRDARPDLQQAA